MIGDGASPGSGGVLSGRYTAGGSLNGVSGGSSLPGAPAGGGTGHPFGSSGRPGTQGQDIRLVTNPVVSARPLYGDPGGYGAGTGGDTFHLSRNNTTEVFTNGGGGGAHATRGGAGTVVIMAECLLALLC